MPRRTAQAAKREFYLVRQSDFLFGDFEDPDEEEVSMTRVYMKPAIEALFSKGLIETLSPDEADHVRKYVFFARELRFSILDRFFEA